YKEWCTEKNAWAVVVPVIIVVALFNIPKTLDSEVTFFNDCVALNRRYNLFLSCLGGTAVGLTVIATAVLLVTLRRNRQSNSQQDAQAQKAATIALTCSSLVFITFGTVQYSYIFLGFYTMESRGSVVQGIHYLTIGQLATIALTCSSLVFITFGTVQYSYIFLGFYTMESRGSVVQGIHYLTIGQLTGAAGISIRGPFLLLMKPMRDS
ncbi:uncharacterized protein LOC142355314, partial [Convolutriloba macropyga]|uniref:uncharacterized protein LOC142355314 n=1 Tax=Convolutriloba macropyga TaxID=536237 RepID=UPI003F51E2A2